MGEGLPERPFAPERCAPRRPGRGGRVAPSRGCAVVAGPRETPARPLASAACPAPRSGGRRVPVAVTPPRPPARPRAARPRAAGPGLLIPRLPQRPHVRDALRARPRLPRRGLAPVSVRRGGAADRRFVREPRAAAVARAAVPASGSAGDAAAGRAGGDGRRLRGRRARRSSCCATTSRRTASAPCPRRRPPTRCASATTSSPTCCCSTSTCPTPPGLDVLREIRACEGVTGRYDPALPVIVLSGRGTDADRVRGFDEGADDYVVKPFHYPRAAGADPRGAAPPRRPARGPAAGRRAVHRPGRGARSASAAVR